MVNKTIKKKTPKTSIIEEDDEEERKNRTLNPIKDENKMEIMLELLNTMEPDEIWINYKTNVAMELPIKENEKKEDKSVKEIVPMEYHDYLDVFDKDKANRFPDSRSWDHKIEMKEDFEPKSFSPYKLTPEQTELDKFLKENLDKGYI